MKWSKEQLDILINLYPNHKNDEIAKILNITKISVQSKAKRLKLFKDKKFKTDINKSRTRDLSYQNLVEIAKKYKTKYDFRTQDNSAYSAACKMNINNFCSHMIIQNISRPELILKYIINKIFNYKILFNNKKIIKPYELDIYIPEFKLAFEYDGFYWHSNNDIDDIKNNLCIEKNIRLIRIIESNKNNNTQDHINNIKTQLKNNLTEINTYCNVNIEPQKIENISNKKIEKYINDNILDYNQIKQITQKYNDYTQFKIFEKKVYRKLVRLNLVNEFTSHMNKRFIYWTIDMCKDEINKYKSFRDFYKNSRKCYHFIRNHNLEYLLELNFNYKKYKKNY